MSNDPPNAHAGPQATTAVDEIDESSLSQLKAMFASSQQHADLMLRAVQTASSSLELNQVLNQIAEMLAIATGVPTCDIYLLDEEQNMLVRRAGTGFPDPARQAFAERLRLDPHRAGLTRRVLSSLEPVLEPDVLAPQVFSHVNYREIVQTLDVRSILALPIKVGRQVLGIAFIVSLGEPHTFTKEVIELAGGITNAVALAVKNAQDYEELRLRLAESQSLQRVATDLLRGTTLPEVLHTVCTSVQQLTGATGSVILKLEEDEWLRVSYEIGEPAPPDRMPVAFSPPGLAVRQGAPVLINDAAELSRLFQAYPHPDFSTLLVVPMRVGAGVIGALAAVNKPGGFNQRDIRVVSLFADQAAICMEHARLVAQVERGAVVEERQRLARELHDSVTQSLYSVTLYADATALALAAGKTGVATNNLRELRETARQAMRDMRLLIFELHPPVLEKEGLAAALQTRLAAVETRAGLQTELRVEGEERLPPAIAQELYGIAQEALNNVIKHSHAQAVTVQLRYTDGAVCLEVCDDGVAFDVPSARVRGGMGLRGIEERAARIGGRLVLASEPGRGTRVRVEVDNKVENKEGA
jgi:signal transduction histidine kinase